MRLIPLWVSIYGFVLGCALLYMGGSVFWGLSLGTNHPTGIASDIAKIASIGSMLVTLAGAAVILAGFILLLIPGKFSAGRVVSVIGIWFYYVAALGIILAGAMFGGSFWENVASIVFIAVCVGLPGFFIIRQFRRLQAEYFEY